MITLAVVTASLSEASSSQMLADRLVAATRAALVEHGEELTIEPIGLRDLAHDITNAMLTGFPSGDLEDRLNALYRATGLIAITPVYKAGMSGLFTSFFDITEDGELANKPALLGATGGTARHSLMIDTAMRPLFAYLKTRTAPTGVFAATDDWGTDESEDGTPSLDARIARAGEEFAIILTRAAGLKAEPKEFGADVDFASMLSKLQS